MTATTFINADLILPDRVLERAAVRVGGECITSVGAAEAVSPDAEDLGGLYLAPGFIDLHVHGGDGADFMDGSSDAFRAVARAHARHGTTSLLATGTVAHHAQHIRFLE